MGLNQALQPQEVQNNSKFKPMGLNSESQFATYTTKQNEVAFSYTISNVRALCVLLSYCYERPDFLN